MKKILVIGSVAADIVIRLDRLPARSEDVHVISQEMRLGGCAAETACDSIVYHNKTYRESGTYLDTMGVTGGNRVIMTLNLTVNHSTAAMQVVRQYEPFTTVTGRVINTTGIYLDTITNVAGCDSVITYDVTIYTTEYEQITETGCDSIVIDGKRYTVSGEYSDTLVAQDGNRTIKTLVLTINHSTRSELTRSACDSYTSSQGIAYTESGGTFA